MLMPEDWMDIKDLHRQGHSIRAIAQITGHARNTVRQALRQKTPRPFQTPERPSCLDPYKPYLICRYRECSLSAVRLLDEIRPMGYAGSLVTVRRFVHTLKAGQRAAARMTVRFETPPGQQAQADWASVGRFEGVGPIHAFVMVLSFSRMLYVEFTTSMDLPALIRCHQSAFAFFGGYPRSVLYDNMKQVRLSPTEWNPLLLDFAHHYGLTPKTHRVRRPRTKGKVERMVDYLKDSFLNGRTFYGLDDLNAQGRHWLETTANVRTHATTGRRPADLLAQEGLAPLDAAAPYQLCDRAERKVDAEGFVRLGRSRYSVPPAFVGRTVLVEQQGQAVRVRCGDLIIAEHERAPSPGACMAKAEHVEALWQLSLTPGGPPVPHVRLADLEAVATRPLAAYEDASEDSDTEQRPGQERPGQEVAQ